MKTMVDEKTAEITRLQQLLKEQREILMREQRLISTAFYEFGTKIMFSIYLSIYFYRLSVLLIF